MLHGYQIAGADLDIDDFGLGRRNDFTFDHTAVAQVEFVGVGAQRQQRGSDGEQDEPSGGGQSGRVHAGSLGVTQSSTRDDGACPSLPTRLASCG